MGKYYKPIIKEGDHLVRSKNNPKRYRGQSRDANNKNPDIVEWEEVEIDNDSDAKQAEKSSIDSLMDSLSTFTAIAGIVADYLEEHPEVVSALKVGGKRIADSASQKIKSFSSNITALVTKTKKTSKPIMLNQIGNEEEPLNNNTIILDDYSVQKETNLEDETIKTEELSIEEARILVINIIENYCNMKRNLDRLSRANINKVNFPELDIKDLIEYMDDITEKYPALIDEKTAVSVLDILKTNTNAIDNQKILEALSIKQDPIMPDQ